MHIPDGFVSGPINLTTAAVSVAACGIALARAKRSLEDRQVPLLGVTAAFVFAAQMLNFPVAAGTSGHFLGAALAAILLGPLNGCLIMTLVLTIQCLGFADGGLTALGTNVFNMGIVGSFGGYAIFALLRRLLPRTRITFLIAVGVSAWFSVVLASAVCALELGLSGTSPLPIVFPTMIGVHLLIGIGEALISAVVVSMTLAVRPDLVGSWHAPQEVV